MQGTDMLQNDLRTVPGRIEQTDATPCDRCGLNHAVLNVEIIGRTLVRKVRGPAHRLKAYGGAFGFSARFWDAHARDIDELIIFDETSGEVFRGKAEAFAQAYRQTFSPAFGPQIVIPLSVLERFADVAEFNFWAQ